MRRFEGRSVLVTGAGSGIGAAIARRFADEGAAVLFTDIDEQAAGAAAEGAGASHARLDVTSQDDWDAAIALAERELGGLHFLINNAGICEMGSVEDLSLESWRRVHSVNLDSVFLGCRAVLPLLSRTAERTDMRASIVNIASVSAIVAAGNMASYNSGKAAVRQLTKSVALHCARRHPRVTCNAILPTFVDTPLLDRIVPDLEAGTLREKLARQIPMRRLGTAADIAGAATFLCSDDAGFMTGADLVIDGGLSVQ